MAEMHPDAAAQGHRSAVRLGHATQGSTLLFRTLKKIDFEGFQIGFSVCIKNNDFVKVSVIKNNDFTNKTLVLFMKNNDFTTKK